MNCLIVFCLLCVRVSLCQIINTTFHHTCGDFFQFDVCYWPTFSDRTPQALIHAAGLYPVSFRDGFKLPVWVLKYKPVSSLVSHKSSSFDPT